MMNCNTKQQTNGNRKPTNSTNNNTWNTSIYPNKVVNKIELNIMYKLTKKTIDFILSIIFPYPDLDPRPDYLFNEETRIQKLFRTGEINDFAIRK